MIIRFKKLDSEAIMPVYSREGDAAVDLVAISRYWDKDKSLFVMGTGIAVEIPRGYVGLIYPRSSISNYNMLLSNHVGVIDSNYRGEIIFKFREVDKEYGVSYCVGDRIGQLIIQPIPVMDFLEVKELSLTNRGASGYGSSGV